MSITFGSGPGTLAYQALRLSGQLMPGATANSDLLADVLFECNSMIDSWNAQELAQYFIDDRYFAITASQQSYTLGPTGFFNTDINSVPLTYRPQRIVRANLILLSTGGGGGGSTTTRIPIEIINVEDFADIPVIDISSQVTIRLYVQTTKDNVTLWCFPYPTAGNQFEFFMWPGFPQFASLAAVFDTPPGWQDYLTYALAERLYFLNTKDLPRTTGQQVNRGAYLKMKRIEAERLVWGSNAPSPTLNPGFIHQGDEGQGAPWNYLYGDYSQ